MKNIKFVAANHQVIRMIILSIVAITFINIMIFVYNDYFPIIFTLVILYWIVVILNSLNVCIFKENTITVKSDDIKFAQHISVQKPFEIKYDEIDFFEIITVRYKDTRGENYLLSFDGKLITKEKRLIGEKALYQKKYSKLDLEILSIHLKNNNRIEGIVLNPFRNKKKQEIIKELEKRINPIK